MRQIARPFGMLLMWLYEFIGNYGLAIILFAIIVRVILLPFSMKQKKGQVQTMLIQPQLNELKKKHGGNQQKLNEETQKLYREHNINPAGGCIWGLLPFPILIALYYAIRCPITTMMGVDSALLSKGGLLYNLLYASDGSALFNSVRAGYTEIAQIQYITEHWSAFKDLAVQGLRQLNYDFLGVNLGEVPDWQFFWRTDWHDPSVWGPGLGLFLIPVITVAFTYLSNHITKKLNEQVTGPSNSGDTMEAMLFMMPLMTLWFGFIMPAALSIYWLIGTVLGIVQDVFTTKHYMKTLAAEVQAADFAAREREAELEAKRAETERLRSENATAVNPSTSKRKQQIQAREEQAVKAAEWEKKNRAPGEEPQEDPSRVGQRRYARGRAYDPNRYGGGDTAPADPDGGETEEEED